MNCPKCSARLSRTAIRDTFACHACGAPLISNLGTWVFGMFVLIVVMNAVVYGVLGGVLDWSPRALELTLAAVIAVAGLIAVLLMPRFITISVSPVRWRGARALDRLPEDAQLPEPAAQLTQEQLQAWRSGTRAFMKKAWIGVSLVVLGLIGLIPASFLGFKSIPLGVLAMSAAAVLALCGYLRNAVLARRHIHCPQCGRYPEPPGWLGSSFPLLFMTELGGQCFHCGTLLPVGIDQREPRKKERLHA